jgi:hypothetical protein
MDNRNLLQGLSGTKLPRGSTDISGSTESMTARTLLTYFMLSIVTILIFVACLYAISRLYNASNLWYNYARSNVVREHATNVISTITPASATVPGDLIINASQTQSTNPLTNNTTVVSNVPMVVSSTSSNMSVMPTIPIISTTPIMPTTPIALTTPPQINIGDINMQLSSLSSLKGSLMTNVANVVVNRVARQTYNQFDEIDSPSSLDGPQGYIGRDYVCFRNKLGDQSFVNKRSGCMACTVDKGSSGANTTYGGTNTNVISTCTYAESLNPLDPDVWTQDMCRANCETMQNIN